MQAYRVASALSCPKMSQHHVRPCREASRRLAEEGWTQWLRRAHRLEDREQREAERLGRLSQGLARLRLLDLLAVYGKAYPHCDVVANGQGDGTGDVESVPRELLRETRDGVQHHGVDETEQSLVVAHLGDPVSGVEPMPKRRYADVQPRLGLVGEHL